MAKGNPIDTMPPEVRKFMRDFMVTSGFTRYEELAELLKEKGHPVAKSTLSKYGKKYRDKIRKLDEVEMLTDIYGGANILDLQKLSKTIVFKLLGEYIELQERREELREKAQEIAKIDTVEGLKEARKILDSDFAHFAVIIQFMPSLVSNAKKVSELEFKIRKEKLDDAAKKLTEGLSAEKREETLAILGEATGVDLTKP